MHLTDEQRAEISRILDCGLPPQVQVFAFGSRVHGRNLKPFSDLDLCLKDEEPVPPTSSELAADFEDSLLPFKVDLVDWATISPSRPLLRLISSLLPKNFPVFTNPCNALQVAALQALA